jgi:hypothetical protein
MIALAGFYSRIMLLHDDHDISSLVMHQGPSRASLHNLVCSARLCAAIDIKKAVQCRTSCQRNYYGNRDETTSKQFELRTGGAGQTSFFAGDASLVTGERPGAGSSAITV